MTAAYDRPHGLMFHHFYNEQHIKGQGAISQEELSQIIEYYQRDHRILPAKDWFDRAEQGTLGKNEICLTFDDALLCQYEVALPVLEHYGLTAFWFVYSSVVSGGTENLEIYRKFRTVFFDDIEDFYQSFFQTVKDSPYQKTVEESLKDFSVNEYLKNFPFYTNEDRRFRYVRDIALRVEAYNVIIETMMQEQKIEMDEFTSDLWMKDHHVVDLHAKNHIIGLHSHTHPTALAALPKESQRAEYTQNFSTLNQLLNAAPKAMSHPCNSYNTETIQILNDLEIKIGFRSNMEENYPSHLEFPREDHANVMERMAA